MGTRRACLCCLWLGIRLLGFLCFLHSHPLCRNALAVLVHPVRAPALPCLLFLNDSTLEVIYTVLCLFFGGMDGVGCLCRYIPDSFFCLRRLILDTVFRI